jgi:hypothetical protein
MESFAELQSYAKPWRAMMEDIYYRKRIVLGDNGLTNKNYGNLGIRIRTGAVVSLDPAYAYDVDDEQLVCMKCPKDGYGMMHPTDDYVDLQCSNPECKKITTFQELRGMISLSRQLAEIGDRSDYSYEVTQPVTQQRLNPAISRYLINSKAEEAKQVALAEKKVIIPDTFSMKL